MQDSYHTKVPGSIMLFGEHAVLHGKKAIVCAVNKYLTAKLSPRNDKQINIKSSTLGNCTISLDNFDINAPFNFIKTAISLKLAQISSGFDLDITGNLSDKVGLGSSAAVTVATLSVLTKWLEGAIIKPQLFSAAQQVIQQVQGIGSGADAAASIFGGIIVYKTHLSHNNSLEASFPLKTSPRLETLSNLETSSRLEALSSLEASCPLKASSRLETSSNLETSSSLEASSRGLTAGSSDSSSVLLEDGFEYEKIAIDLPLTLVYSGKKLPTKTVIALVEKLKCRFPEIFSSIFSTMEQCTEAAVAAIKSQDLKTLGHLMNIHHGLQDALGVNNQALAEIIFTLREAPEIFGAKISGAGLGDCIVGLGKISSESFPGRQIGINISLAGAD